MSEMDEDVAYVLRRVLPSDIELLRLIVNNGPVWHGRIKRELGVEEGKNALLRSRVRELVRPIRHSNGYYQYDVTDLGVRVLNAVEEGER